MPSVNNEARDREARVFTLHTLRFPRNDSLVVPGSVRLRVPKQLSFSVALLQLIISAEPILCPPNRCPTIWPLPKMIEAVRRKLTFL